MESWQGAQQMNMRSGMNKQTFDSLQNMQNSTPMPRMQNQNSHQLGGTQGPAVMRNSWTSIDMSDSGGSTNARGGMQTMHSGRRPPDMQNLMNSAQSMQNVANMPRSQMAPDMQNMTDAVQSMPIAQRGPGMLSFVACPPNVQNLALMPRGQGGPDLQNLMHAPQSEPSRQAMGDVRSPIHPSQDAIPRGQAPLHMQNAMALHEQGLREVQGQQNRSVGHMGNMQSQLMQVIALPVGAPPPEGAIPMGMPSTIQDTASPQAVKVIAVPIGSAPPEGAVPLEQYSNMPAAKPDPWQTVPSSKPWEAASKAEAWQTPSKFDAWETPTKDENWQEAWKSEVWTPRLKEPWQEVAKPEPVSSASRKKAFKIKDPKTGKQIRSPEEEAAAAPRRMRIVNPNTGKEINADR
jgi:hypothetical protein